MALPQIEAGEMFDNTESSTFKNSGEPSNGGRNTNGFYSNDGDQAQTRALDEHDQKVLRDHAIPKQLWGSSYYTELDDGKIGALGAFKKNAAPTLVLIGHRPSGHLFYQLRPHAGAQRYLFARGAGGAIHVSPLTREHLDDPTVPMLIGESLMKTDAAAEPWPDAEVCSIGFGGAYGFRGINAKSGKTVSDDLRSELIAWKGRDAAGNEFPRKVWILFDSDVQTNPNVLAAARRVAAFMRSKGAEVHIVALPRPTDPSIKALAIDDWRAANPNATFAELRALELKEDINSASHDYAIQKEKIERRFCLIENTWTIYDRVTGQTLSVYAFLNVAAAPYTFTDSRGKECSAAARWLRDNQRQTFKSLVLDPGGTPEGCLNLFTGFAVNGPIQGDTLWWDGPQGLLTHVISDPLVREAIERVLAWPFAHPEQWKVFVAIVIIGAHGVGKDQLGEAICRLIGESHVARITGSHINSPYDGFLLKPLFIKGEEIDVNRQSANKLKKWIVSPSHILNPKCDRQIEIPNRTNFFFSSNDVKPIFISSDSERRYLVYESPAEPMSEEMANLVAAKLSDPVALSALLYRFKHQVNFEGFNPHAPAMKTADFYELANDTSLSDIDRFVERMINDPPDKLGASDIWRSADVASFLPDELKRRPGSETALTRSMKSLRFRAQIARLGLVSVRGSKLNLWAVRNGPEWKERGSAAAATEYLRANPEAAHAYKAPKF